MLRIETKILFKSHEKKCTDLTEYRMLGSLLYYELTCGFRRRKGRSCGIERYVGASIGDHAQAAEAVILT